MGVKKRLLWIMVAFFGVMFVFSACFPQEFGNMVRAYDPAVNGDEIESAVDGERVEPGAYIDAKVQPADPIGFLSSGTGGAGGVDGALEITIYEQDLALVKERREIELKSGVNLVEYGNVAARIDPASVMVEDPENRDTAVIEQNYEYDLVSSYSLLEKYLEKEITVTAGDCLVMKKTALSLRGKTATSWYCRRS